MNILSYFCELFSRKWGGVNGCFFGGGKTGSLVEVNGPAVFAALKHWLVTEKTKERDKNSPRAQMAHLVSFGPHFVVTSNSPQLFLFVHMK